MQYKNSLISNVCAKTCQSSIEIMYKWRKQKKKVIQKSLAQSARAEEYTDCISAER